MLSVQSTYVDVLEEAAGLHAQTPAEAWRAAQLQLRVQEALAALPEREAAVLRLHYGLEGRPHTYREVRAVSGLQKCLAPGCKPRS